MFSPVFSWVSWFSVETILHYLRLFWNVLDSLRTCLSYESSLDRHVRREFMEFRKRKPPISPVKKSPLFSRFFVSPPSEIAHKRTKTFLGFEGSGIDQLAERGTKERTPTRMAVFWPGKTYLEIYDVS